jgi:hypothetical protein
MATQPAGAPESSAPSNFETHPSRYRHWRLTIERSGSAGPRSAAEGQRGGSIDDECRKAAYSYQLEVPVGPAAEIAIRITNAQ